MSDKQENPTPIDETEENELPDLEQAMEENVPDTTADDADPFADIRRSLVEEETAKREKKNNGILSRVTGLWKTGRKKTAPLEVEESETKIEKADAPVWVGEDASVVESGPTLEQEAGGSDSDELLAVLFPHVETVEERVEELRSELVEHPEPEAEPVPKEVKVSEIPHVQPEKKAVETDFETMRGVALEGYDETAAASEEQPAVTRQRKYRVFFKSLKPVDRFMIFGALLLIVVAGMTALGLKVFGSASQMAAITPEPTQDLPIPVRVTLPGGWEFKLSRGRVVDEKWSPSGAEWLEGTEVCRWVALPWSLQLEAVVRTLKLDDPIDLTMSNADQLSYRVQSIQNVPVGEIESLAGKKVCLLLILVDKDSDTRWVVTAIP